jgi:hypothetical protein
MPQTEQPAAPQLLAPADGADVTGIPALSWSNVDGASDYRLQVAADLGFGNRLVNRGGLSSTMTSIPDAETGTTYYWRVLATTATCHGSWSETRSFTISEAGE